jgi:hypothetical protein
MVGGAKVFGFQSIGARLKEEVSSIEKYNARRGCLSWVEERHTTNILHLYIPEPCVSRRVRSIRFLFSC